MRQLGLFVISILLTTSCINLVLIPPSDAESSIIYVHPGESIQEAINRATVGDVIFVYNGTYNEHIILNKKGLLLQGENKYSTILDLQHSSGDAIRISAEGITVQGFTIMNTRYIKDIWNQSGIVIASSNVTITDNIFTNNQWGLVSYVTASNLTVCDNMFFYDGFFPGCYISWFNGSFAYAETIPMKSLLFNVYNNTVNGKPLYYYINIHDTVVNADAGQVILINCTNVTVKNLNLTNIDFSVMLYYCSHCLIEHNTIQNADGELILFFSENNTIQSNTIQNAFHCICLDIGSKNNNVLHNKIGESLQGITILTAATGNRVYGNEFTKNTCSMVITSYMPNLPSHDNVVYENTFTKNKYGILLIFNDKNPLIYTYNNTIMNNYFLLNFMGIFINRSEQNRFVNNTFKYNFFSAVFFGCSQNFWDGNFWNRGRLFPQIIPGYALMNNNIPIPWVNVDWHPAQQPYTYS